MASPSSSICVIVPTYNRADLIRELIDSVLSQTRPVQQIIVVSDGSTDDTESVVKSYGNRITLITKQNGGRASAINAGLSQCQCDYVWVVDDDDLAASDGIEPLAAALDRDSTIDFAYGTYQYFHDGASGRSYNPPVNWNYDDEPNINIRFLEGMFTHLSAVLVRHSLYKKTGPYREELLRAQDFDMAIRLSRRAKAVHVPKIIFFYREHEGMRGTATDRFSASENIMKWLGYEQKILSWVRQEFPLDEFTPTFALQWDHALAKRVALLQRACVFAKRSMWGDALDDFREASALSAAPATPQEIKLAERVIKYLPPWEALCKNPGWLAAIRTYYSTDEYGNHIIHAASRPLVGQARYWFKNGNTAGGIRALKTLVKVLGVRGACRRVSASFLD